MLHTYHLSAWRRLQLQVCICPLPFPKLWQEPALASELKSTKNEARVPITTSAATRRSESVKDFRFFACLTRPKIASSARTRRGGARRSQGAGGSLRSKRTLPRQQRCGSSLQAPCPRLPLAVHCKLES